MEINPSPPPPPPAPPNISPDPSLNHPDDHKAPPLNDEGDDDVTLGLTNLLLDQDPHSDSDSDSEFTFMCVIDAPDADDDSVTTESDKSGTTRPVFPLFDQSLLLPSKDDRESRLTSHVPVNKVFIETSPSTSSSTSSLAATVICASVSKEEAEPAEINIKSNSTGFSKLWRFRNEMNRSNSDGRDAYVFLQTPNNNNSKGKTSVVNDVVSGGKAKKKKKENDVVEGEEGKGKKAAAAVVKKGGKVKKSTESAHEVYLKQKKKSGKTEEERRRSYLPYRPGLMGFFTNVNGGLSKNVHPF